MEIAQIIPHVEALIFASDHPLPAMEIMELLNNAQGFLEDVATPDQVMSAIEAVKEKYNSAFYSFEVKESGGGFQFLTKSDFFPTVAQLNGDKYLKKLSTAAMETLAIIAYKQPITKGDIESIRGVNSDYSIQKLLEKELIMISGRREEIAGKPLIYVTSRSFMDYFGINSPDDLPLIKEILQEDLAHPTVMQDGMQLSEEIQVEEGLSDPNTPSFAVSENGELLVQDTREGQNEAAIPGDMEAATDPDENNMDEEDPENRNRDEVIMEDEESERTDMDNRETNEEQDSEDEENDKDDDDADDEDTEGDAHDGEGDDEQRNKDPEEGP